MKHLGKALLQRSRPCKMLLALKGNIALPFLAPSLYCCFQFWVWEGWRGRIVVGGGVAKGLHGQWALSCSEASQTTRHERLILLHQDFRRVMGLGFQLHFIGKV